MTDLPGAPMTERDAARGREEQLTAEIERLRAEVAAAEQRGATEAMTRFARWVRLRIMSEIDREAIRAYEQVARAAEHASIRPTWLDAVPDPGGDSTP